jgi:excinuclease UvrABC nuclease subunit
LKGWEPRWQSIGLLTIANLSSINAYVGVHRAKLNGQLMYIRRAIEWNNGGFRKRLSDYIRNSDSARKHRSGSLIHKHRHELYIDTDKKAEAAAVADNLESALIEKYNPPWNKMRKIKS